MDKFKPLRNIEKAMIELSVESTLAEIDQRIAQDHLVRLVQTVVFLLDTNSIEANYSFLGQKPYHPKLMLSILFYGYATGVRSSRILEDKCISDDYYKFLMQYYTPDHRTISDFRKNHLDEINNHFVDILMIFLQLGYTNVGKVYIDGSKLKANASTRRTKDASGHEKLLSIIREEVEEILKEAEKIDREEDERCQTKADQEELKKRLSNRNYLKNKIEEALKTLREEEKKKINLTDMDANNMKS